MEDTYLKVAEWPWQYVATYFFVGGVAAGAYLLAAIADIFGDSKTNAPLIKTGRSRLVPGD